MKRDLIPNKTINVQKDNLGLLLLLGTLAYFVSILWINFHAKQWYSFDIYSDAFLSRIMVEQKSLFPENWVYGNQYYVIATPILAAVFYALLHDTVLAMACASSVMTITILLSFLWAVKLFTDKKSRLVGLFALSGAIILGNSASSYGNGMGYFYTMASFYACYVITIFLTLGIYFRLYYKKPVSPIAVLVSGCFSLALGIQSLRGMLMLYLPLTAVAFLMFLFGGCRKSAKCACIYTTFILVIDFIGIIIIKHIPVKSAPIIGDISLTSSLPDLLQNFKTTTSELLSITGLRFCTYGLKWLPLFAIALFYTAIVLLALVKIIKNRNDTMIEWAILFFWISVLAVYVVGIFLFRVRAIYFFTWYLLVVFSFVYIAKECSIISKPAIVLLLMAGFANYILNFVPDFLGYAGRDAFFQSETNVLIDEGIDCVYYDVHASPLFAVYSKDNIVSGTVFLDPTEKSGGLMYPVGYLEPLDVFRNADQYNAYMVFTNWTFDYLEKNTSDEYVEKLMANLNYVRKVSYQGEEFTYYKFSPELLNFSE